MTFSLSWNCLTKQTGRQASVGGSSQERRLLILELVGQCTDLLRFLSGRADLRVKPIQRRLLIPVPQPNR
jgi:hypothetical protein